MFYPRMIGLAFMWALTFTLPGCSEADPKPIAGKSTIPIKQRLTTSTERDICVVKDDKALILINLFAELDQLQTLDGPEQDTYFCWRAAKSMLEKGLSHENLVDQQDFVVRLVIVKSLDEYGRQKWGDAIEVARLETSRSVLEPYKTTALQSLDDATVVGLFTNKKLQADSLKKLVR